MTATLTSEKSTSALADLHLKDVLKTLPRSCFQKDSRKAWASVVFSSFAVGLGYWSIANLPWFLLPLGWIFTGTALTGCFVIAHDCGHRSFAKRRWVNDWVGHFMTLPLIYPFHSWRLLHNHHHAHTNKLGVDNAWEPFTPEFYGSLGKPWQWGYQALRGRFWWIASIVHWAGIHFDLNQFQPKYHKQVKISIAAVLIFGAIAFPVLIATTGIWGFVKFWLLPWMVFHFWMSTFTLVHHTAPDIEFREPQEWHAATAQLSGTVHCDYPMWVELLCHHINVHVPHHLSTAIPSYNLRMAHESLRQNWGQDLQECQFSWTLMKQITDRCHLYHPSEIYQSFQKFHAESK